jgi:hypothetical protein
MSYDKYWDCPSLDAKTWIQYLPGNGPIPNRRFAVSVSHGENCLVDELYLFSTFENAHTFYSKDVESRQYNNGGRLLGFENVSLIETTHDIALAERKLSGQRRGGHRSFGRGTAYARRVR